MKNENLSEKMVRMGLETVQILANKLGVPLQAPDLTLGDAIRFAESLILVAGVEKARTAIQEDQKGTLAFLLLAEQFQLSEARKSVPVDPDSAPVFLTFAPVCTWFLEEAKRRGSEL